VVLENVAAILTRGLGEVLIGLESVGYDAEWHCIPASAIDGCPHRRDRWWCVADTDNDGQPPAEIARSVTPGGDSSPTWAQQTGESAGLCSAGKHDDVADTDSQRGCSGNNGGKPKPDMGLLADGVSVGLARSRWLAEPGVGRVATGIPDRTSRLKALGNSLIPQIPEIIGREILRQRKCDD